MRKYGICRMEGALDWKRIPRLSIDRYLWAEECGIRAWGQIAYDDVALHVRLSAEEHDIRAEHRGRPHPVAEDSCLEFFFCPQWGDERYFNVEFNSNCALYLGFGSGIHNLVRLLVQDEEAMFGPRSFRVESGWGVEYRIPHEFVRRFMPEYAPGSGKEIRANCYKCGDKTLHRHYIAWNPVNGDVPDFHRPEDFGHMVFI